jgi:hypothetical protein
VAVRCRQRAQFTWLSSARRSVGNVPAGRSQRDLVRPEPLIEGIDRPDRQRAERETPDRVGRTIALGVDVVTERSNRDALRRTDA